jgi:hypothetical protein
LDGSASINKSVVALGVGLGVPLILVLMLLAYFYIRARRQSNAISRIRETSWNAGAVFYQGQGIKPMYPSDRPVELVASDKDPSELHE